MKSRSSISSVIWLAILICGLAAGTWWWWAGQGEGGDVSYRTATLARGPLQAHVSATGTVAPVTQVQISSQVSGQIASLLVDFNSEVRRGQLLARLDPQTYEHRVRQASADVEAAQAAVLTAQANVLQAQAQQGRAEVDQAEAARDYARRQDLLAQNFISAAELDTARARVATLTETNNAARAQVQVARAQVQNAQAIVRQRQAQLQQARVDLERTQIRSPVDGIVIKRSVEVGQTVAASLQAPELFVVARDLEDMQVQVSIDEADVGRVTPGQKASFTVDSFPGRDFEGTVSQVRKSSATVQNVVTYTVIVGFANPGSILLPGMTANVRIVTDTRDDVLMVPNPALRVRIAGVQPDRTLADAPQGNGTPTAVTPGRRSLPGRIYLLGADGQPSAHDVRLGIGDGTMTELLPVDDPALVPGATVITAVQTGNGRAAPAVRRSPF